jgi:hypothetical protein
MESNEKDISAIKAYYKGVNGCVRHKKDVMIAYTVDREMGICDLFLTNEQAQKLMEDLQNALRMNKEYEG